MDSTLLRPFAACRGRLARSGFALDLPIATTAQATASCAAVTLLALVLLPAMRRRLPGTACPGPPGWSG